MWRCTSVSQAGANPHSTRVGLRHLVTIPALPRTGNSPCVASSSTTPPQAPARRDLRLRPGPFTGGRRGDHALHRRRHGARGRRGRRARIRPRGGVGRRRHRFQRAGPHPRQPRPPRSCSLRHGEPLLQQHRQRARARRARQGVPRGSHQARRHGRAVLEGRRRQRPAPRLHHHRRHRF